METIKIEDENGKVYEFEKPDFECELLKIVSGIVMGYITTFNGEIISGHWDNGAFISGRANYKDWNLKPIKPKWYENENNFPALMIHRNNRATVNNESEAIYAINNGFRLATKDERDSFYYEGKEDE